MLDRETQMAPDAGRQGGRVPEARAALPGPLQRARARGPVLRGRAGAGARQPLRPQDAGAHPRRATARAAPSCAAASPSGCTDARLRTALRLRAAADQDKGPAPRPRWRSYRRAFARGPARRAAGLRAGARRCARRGTTPALAELYQRRLEVATRPAERAGAAAAQRASCARRGSDDLDRAPSPTEPRWSCSRSCLPALQGARRVALKRGRLRRAPAPLLEAEARASRDPRSAIEALRRRGAARRSTAQRRGGRHRPLPQGAGARPARPGGQRGPGGAARPARRRGGPRGAARAARRGRLAQRDAAAAAAAFFTAARTWLDALGDRAARAGARVERALAAQPNHPDALELRGQLLPRGAAVRRGRRDARASACSRAATPAAVAALHLTLGALYQDQLERPGPRGRAPADRARRRLPRSAEALERLAGDPRPGPQLDRRGGLPQAAAGAGAARARRARATRVALARIHDEGLGRRASASALYRQALELAPGDAALVDRLVGALRARRQPAGAGRRCWRPRPQARPPDAEARRSRCGCAWRTCTRGPLDQPAARHRACYRQVLASRTPPNVPGPRGAGGPVHARRRRGPLAIEEHRQLLAPGARRAWRACTRSSGCGRA